MLNQRREPKQVYLQKVREYVNGEQQNVNAYLTSNTYIMSPFGNGGIDSWG